MVAKFFKERWMRHRNGKTLKVQSPLKNSDEVQIKIPFSVPQKYVMRSKPTSQPNNT